MFELVLHLYYSYESQDNLKNNGNFLLLYDLNLTSNKAPIQCAGIKSLIMIERTVAVVLYVLSTGLSLLSL